MQLDGFVYLFAQMNTEIQIIKTPQNNQKIKMPKKGR